MKKRLRILVISYSPLHRDSRVRRQIFALKNKYTVTAAGLTDPVITEARFIKIGSEKQLLPKWLKIHVNIWARRLKLHDITYWKDGKLFDLKQLRRKRYDLVIANDIDALPMACALGGNPKILADMHEYFPLYLEFDQYWKDNIQEEIIQRCKKYFKKADVITTVCDALAGEYNRKIFQTDIKVIKNCPPFHGLNPSKVRNKIRIIHHGIASKRRKVENMILAMDQVDKRYSLDLMLVNIDDNYYEKIRSMAASRSNVHIIPPVSPEDIVYFINNYDIGLIWLEPISFNLKMALPNKLFECIQARLAIVTGPSPSIASIVNQYQCGFVASDFSLQNLASLLNSLLSDEIFAMKNRASEAAKIENFEMESKKLNLLAESLLEHT